MPDETNKTKDEAPAFVITRASGKVEHLGQPNPINPFFSLAALVAVVYALYGLYRKFA